MLFIFQSFLAQSKKLEVEFLIGSVKGFCRRLIRIKNTLKNYLFNMILFSVLPTLKASPQYETAFGKTVSWIKLYCCFVNLEVQNKIEINVPFYLITYKHFHHSTALF